MRRYGNMLGVPLVGLALLLGAGIVVRQVWDWTIPGVLGLGPLPFKHLLGLLLLGLAAAGLLHLGRQRFPGRG